MDLRAVVERISVEKKRCTMSYSAIPDCGRYEVIVPKANQCPSMKADGDWRCKGSKGMTMSAEYGVVIGDEKLLDVLEIDDPAAATPWLGVRSSPSTNVMSTRTDSVGIQMISDIKAAEKAMMAGKETPGEIKRFPVLQAGDESDTYGISMIIPPSAARAAGIPPSLSDPTSRPTECRVPRSASGWTVGSTSWAGTPSRTWKRATSARAASCC
ncbi:hypothetical protein ACWGIN_27265 [Streptomyces sp. NPDC054861]